MGIEFNCKNGDNITVDKIRCSLCGNNWFRVIISTYKGSLFTENLNQCHSSIVFIKGMKMNKFQKFYFFKSYGGVSYVEKFD